MKPLVIVDCRQDGPAQEGLGIISHLADQSLETTVLCVHPQGEAFADTFAAVGAAHLIVAKGSAADQPIQPLGNAIVDLLSAGRFDTLVMASSVRGVDLAAYAAGKLGAGLAWNLVELDLTGDRPKGRRLTSADSLSAEITWTSPVAVALIRQNQFAPKERQTQPISAETLQLDVPGGITQLSTSPGAERPMLAQADIVVSAGRGLASPEKMALVEDLAAVLGGAMGVSLPLVQAGLAPRSMQVGQTGTAVQPKLYIACGISGQYQHKLGMERSGVIVAINSDRSAPIMGFCDLGIVGDATEFVPRLTAALRRQGQSGRGQ